MENIGDRGAAMRDPCTEIQKVKTTRGGICYDLRPQQQEWIVGMQ